MPCGAYSNHSNVSGYYSDYVAPFSYQNTTCYVWNNVNECGASYFVDNSGCYKNSAFLNYVNYANLPHDDVPAWSDDVFTMNWNDHTDDWIYDGGIPVLHGEDWDDHLNEILHSNDPYLDDPWYNWNNHRNTPFNNFCNHTDTYI